MNKIERMGINTIFGVVMFLLLLFSGIQVPNIYITSNSTEGNFPIMIAFIIVFSVFICFNLKCKIKKDQALEKEVMENEE